MFCSWTWIPGGRDVASKDEIHDLGFSCGGHRLVALSSVILIFSLAGAGSECRRVTGPLLAQNFGRYISTSLATPGKSVRLVL